MIIYSLDVLLSKFETVLVPCSRVHHAKCQTGWISSWNQDCWKNINNLRYAVFPGSSISKKSTCSAGHPSLIPGLERSPREGNGNPLQYSGLENPIDRGAWQASVCGVIKSWRWLSILSNWHSSSSAVLSELSLTIFSIHRGFISAFLSILLSSSRLQLSLTEISAVVSGNRWKIVS